MAFDKSIADSNFLKTQYGFHIEQDELAKGSDERVCSSSKDIEMVSSLSPMSTPAPTHRGPNCPHNEQQYAAATTAACAKALCDVALPSPRSDILRSLRSDEDKLLTDKRIRSHLSNDATPAGRFRDQPPFLVPFPENLLFVGRGEVLSKLQSLLFEGTCREVVLTGLGGLGKTEIALRLAYWVKRNEPDSSVFWIPAFSMASFEQGCLNIVQSLGIMHPEGEDEDARETVRKYLNSKSAGKWFLVIDNADDMSIIQGSTHSSGGILAFLPSNDDGRTLITTRSTQVAVAVAREEIVTLNQMSLEEASELLKKSLMDGGGPRNDELRDDQVVTKLLEALEFLPEAILQAATYMSTYGTSASDYIRSLDGEDGGSLLGLLQTCYESMN